MSRERMATLAVVVALMASHLSAHQSPAPSAGSAAVPTVVTPTPVPDGPVTLAGLEQLAVERNPSVEQAVAQIERARGRARQAGAWPNPVVGYVGEEIAGGAINRGGEHGFFVEQTFPISGRLGLSRTVFEKEEAEANATADVVRQQVRNAVRRSYYRAVIADRRVALSEQLERLTREAVDVSSQLYNVGAADRPDRLEAEIEAQRATLDLLAARNVRFRVWRELGASVGDPLLSPRPIADAIARDLPEIDRDAAWQAILDGSPELRAARAAAETANASVGRAKRETVPDLFVRAGPRYNRELLEPRLEPVGWEAAIEAGLTLPLWNRNDGGVAEATAGQVRSTSEVRRVELALAARLADAFERYLTALSATDVYRTEILPRAELAHSLYLDRYREMAAAYPQVLIAQRTFAQSMLQYLEALERGWVAAVEIQGLLVPADDERRQ